MKKLIIITLFGLLPLFSNAQTLQFNNKTLEASVKSQLGISQSAVINQSIADTVTMLDFHGLNLQNISDLTKFTNLSWVNLTANSLTSICELKSLKNLSNINCNNNNLTSIDCLNDFESPTLYISVKYNNITSFDKVLNTFFPKIVIYGQNEQHKSNTFASNQIYEFNGSIPNSSLKYGKFYYRCYSPNGTLAIINFGDGTSLHVNADGIGQYIQHTYPEFKDYSVRLTCGTITQDVNINLGGGTPAIIPSTTPSIPSSNFRAGSTNFNSSTIQWTKGNGQYRLITCTPTSETAIKPADGKNYYGNMYYDQATVIGGNTKVVYSGSKDEMLFLENLQPGITYKLVIYEYNGDSDGNVKYLYTPEISLILTTLKVEAKFEWENVVCYMAGSAYNFFNASPGANIFQWSVNPSATIDDPTSDAPKITFPVKGNYTVTLLAKNAESGSQASFSQTFVIEDENSVQLDLTLKDLTISTANPKQNQNVTANVKLINLSRQQLAPDFYVTFALSPDSVYDFNLPNGNDWGLGGQKLSIKENETLDINYQFQMPTTIGTGKKYLIAKADGTDIYQEGNESNNILIIPINIVAGQPDLTITNLSLSNNVIEAGKKFSITQTIKNTGEVATDVANPNYDGITLFVISKDNILDNSDLYFGQTLFDNTKGLYPNNSSTTTRANYVLPPDFMPGNYFLIGLLDYKYPPYNGYKNWSVDELNEDNNTYVIPFTVSNPNEPTQCATNLSLSNISVNSLTLSWTNGNGNSRIVIGCERPLTNDSKGISVPEYPVDGMTYSAISDWSAGTYLTNTTSKVLYVGTGNSVNVTNLTNNKTYIFSVFEFNSSSLNYLQRTTERAISTHLQPANSTNNWKSLLSGVYCGGLSYNGDKITAQIHRYVAVSEDAGKIWKFYNFNFKEEQNSPKAFPEFMLGNDGLLASGNNFLYKTIDAGKTWFRITSNSNSLITEIRGFSVHSVNVMYILGNDNVIKTEDGGYTWKNILITNEFPYSMFFLNELLGFIVTSNGTVYKTENGGNMWNSYKIDAAINWFNVPRIKFRDKDFGIITASDKIYITNNGGRNWTKSTIPAGTTLYNETMIFDDKNIIINANQPGNALLISKDNGLNWSTSLLNNLPSSYSSTSYITGKYDNLYYGKIDGIFKTNTLGANSGIVLVNVPSQQLCPSSIINIDFQMVGLFGADNKVALQLSDASGSFDSPTTLRTISTTSSGTITGTMPYNISVSNNYRLRIVATNPQCVSSVSSPLTFSFSTVLNFNNLRDSIVLNSSAIPLSATPSGGSFKVDGTISTIFNPSTVGKHSIAYAYTTNGCTQTLEKEVIVYEPQSIIQNTLKSYIYYSGAKMNVPYTLKGNWDNNTFLLAQLSDAQGSFANPTQIVYKNSNISDTLKSVIPSNTPTGSTYKVKITNLDGTIVSNLSNPIRITAALAPEVSIKANSASQCSNSATSFLATGKNLGTKPSFQWYVNGVPVGSNSNFFSAVLSNGDVVQVKATSSENNVTQQEVYSPMQNITVVTQPETPIVVQFDSILVSSAMEGNQWYKDGVPISEATDQFYSPKETGAYSVIVNATPCTAVSSSNYNYTVHSGVNNVTISGINLYPNPAKSEFTITDLDNSIKYRYVLNDITGKQYVINNISNLNVEKVDVEKIPAGIYVLLLYKADSNSLIGIEKVVIK